MVDDSEIHKEHDNGNLVLNESFVNETIESIFAKAYENKSLFNDKCKMLAIYEKYGFEHRYRFVVFEDLVFIGVINPNSTHPETVFITVIRVKVHGKTGYSRSLKPPPTFRNDPKKDSFRRMVKLWGHSSVY